MSETRQTPVQETPAPPEADADLFSCTVSIRNDSKEPMLLVQSLEQYGEWETLPPQGSIAPGASADFVLNQEPGGFYGTQGYATYIVKDTAGNTGNIKFFFACPISGDNVADWVWDPYPNPHPNVTATYVTQNGINPTGHPVTVLYTVTGG
jgi:hypothetical protein